MREGPERTPVVVEEAYDDLARRVARPPSRTSSAPATRREKDRAGPRHGLHPDRNYRELIASREEGLDFSSSSPFNLDEYYPMLRLKPTRFMWEPLESMDPKQVHTRVGYPTFQDRRRHAAG